MLITGKPLAVLICLYGVALGVFPIYTACFSAGSLLTALYIQHALKRAKGGA